MVEKPKCFILDVDGVMTSGHFFYTNKGKYLKCFGPDDNDGLSLLRSFIEIRFVTGDKKGFDISKHGIQNAKSEIKKDLFIHKAQDKYPYQDNQFDLVISLGCLHNLKIFELETALKEIERVGKKAYLMLCCSFAQKWLPLLFICCPAWPTTILFSPSSTCQM